MGTPFIGVSHADPLIDPGLIIQPFKKKYDALELHPLIFSQGVLSFRVDFLGVSSVVGGLL